MSRRNKRIENILNNPSTPPSSEHINSSHDINNSENNSSEINSSKKKGNKRKKTEDISTQGRWTDYEHKRFVEGLRACGKNWKLLESYVPTRSSTQIRSHAQKFFIRIEKQHRTKDPLEYIRHNTDTASNCSNSGISIPIQIQCECEIHSKKPEHFGTFLHPNYLSDTKESSTPCSCACTKCLHYNRPNISKGKVIKIKKRIQKVLKKIDQNDHNISQFNSSSDYLKTVSNEVKKLRKGSKFPSFTNLIGLKMMLMTADITPQSKEYAFHHLFKAMC